MQSFIEIVFFFNPAVLWVSQLIKTEREHCCDDLAIACVNDRKNYVQALIICQEFKQRAPAYAMAITGKKGSLLHRASRMLFNTNSTLNKMEKTILTIALISVVVCTAAFKSVGNAKTVTSNAISTSILVQQDTTKKSKPAETKSADQLEKEINAKMDRQLKKLNEKEKLKKNETDEDVKARVADQKARNEDMWLAEEDAKQAVLDGKQAESDRKQAIVDAKIAEADVKIAESDRKQAIADAKLAEADAIQAIAYAKQAARDAKEYAKWAKENKQGEGYQVPPRAPRPLRAPRAISATPTTPAVPPVPPTPVTSPTSPVYNERTGSRTSTQRMFTSKTVTDGDGHDYTGEINKQLMKDGIISNTNKLSYKLNKNELIVNGVAQNAEIQKRYRQQFLKNDKHALMYNFLIENKN